HPLTRVASASVTRMNKRLRRDVFMYGLWRTSRARIPAVSDHPAVRRTLCLCAVRQAVRCCVEFATPNDLCHGTMALHSSARLHRIDLQVLDIQRDLLSFPVDFRVRRPALNSIRLRTTSRSETAERTLFRDSNE